MSSLESSILVDDLRKLYARHYSCDIGRFFIGDAIKLERNEQFGYFQFVGASSGDELFYADLMGEMGYDDADKTEFRFASQLIDEDQHVLDIGCGVGNFSVHAKLYKGIDLNKRAVAEARRLGRNVREEALEEQSRDWNIVTMFQVLEHVEDPIGFFGKAASCVKPGGRLIVSVPDMDGPIGSAINQFLNYPPHHLTWWNEKSLRTVFEHFGFSDICVWREPLQRTHFKTLIYSMLRPRRDKHIDFSIRALGADIMSSIFWRLMPRDLLSIPFATGQVLLVTGISKPAGTDLAPYNDAVSASW